MQNRLGLNLQGASAGLTGEVNSAHIILTAISRKLFIYTKRKPDLNNYIK